VWPRKRPSGDVTPDMNVTPLVDVVLVLLIIFMVVAPRLDQDVQVELPGIFNPDPEVEMAAEPFKVTVAQVGVYHLEGRAYGLDEIVDHLAAEHAVDPYRRLLLRADARLRYGDVRDIFYRLQQVGFPGIALMVGERRRIPEPSIRSAPDLPHEG
jgi:biopolymer transport protein TolR